MRSHLGVLGLAWSLLAGCGGGDGSLVVRAVSELGGTPIAGVNVQVGDRGWATTGSNGEVRFAGVTAPYTAVVHQPMTREVFQGTYQHDAIWKLVGLTANPLVVHVDGRLAQKYRSQLFGTVVGRSGNVGTQVRIG